jgi:hypothetical protein
MRQVWEYETDTGSTARGVFLRYSDRGGTDVTYWFHRLADDGATPITHDNGGATVDLVAGARLKAARRIGALPAPAASN